MECGIIIKTIECDCKDNTTSLNSSQQQVDMYNGEKEISDVVVESQAANPKSGPSSMMDYFIINICGFQNCSGKPPSGSLLEFWSISNSTLGNNLVNLKKIDLKYSPDLIEIPDLSKAEKLETVLR
ncbi:hypothetical protein JHK87_024637 [Glycine soja]|nr:hypothetical protein JHK87_024637 [Glycine soja]